MTNRKTTLWIVSLTILTFIQSGLSQNSMEGAWAVKSIEWITADTTYSIPDAQPGILLYTDSHYSFIWTPIPDTRVPFKVLAQPTDEEIKSAFQSVVFNAGIYAISNDSILIHTALIARVPGFEGGEQIFRYQLSTQQLSEDQLILTFFDETYPDGTKPSWYGKMKTRFVFSRMD